MKLGVPTLVNYELLDRLLESAERGSVTPTGYVIVDNGGRYQHARSEEIIGRRRRGTVELVVPGANLGVAASWNRILDLAGDEPIVISNDDVILGARTFERMRDALTRALFVSCDGWALFGQRPECTRLVGVYDENIWPAYYEDVDYDIRLSRAGVVPERLSSCGMHHAGWTTTRRLGDPTALSQQRERNRQYVIAKWGGDRTDSAKYQEPFDGDPPPGWAERKRTAHTREGERGQRRESSRQTIALCMIVRDEAAVIARCLESVRPLIDAWVICDTGSQDGTPQLIERLLEGVPGRLHHRRWRDFGSNRTDLMALAAGSADYLLLLDADMTLNWRGALPRLWADAYLVRDAGEVAYAVPRLVRGDRRWSFQGSTHEYLAADGPHAQEVLEGVVVEHHADGGARAVKLERDAALLERDLACQPDEPRATFYLAQTYRDMGDDQRAIDLYLRRASLGGWDEEVFYAAYQAGVLLAKRDEDDAFGILVGAWQRRMSRAEPLHELARLLRYRGSYRAAYIVAKRGADISWPEDLLFVHRWIYDWGLRFELAVAAYWLGDVDVALAHFEALLADGRLPPEIDAAVRENVSFCIARGAGERQAQGNTAHRAPTARGDHDPVPLNGLCPSFEHQALELDVSLSWPQFNPTIAADGDSFRAIVRTANYRIVDGRYELLGDHGVIRTINYSVSIGGDLTIVAASPLVDSSMGPRIYPSRVQGYEDCRLVRVGDAWFATATVRDRNPSERCETALVSLQEDTMTAVTILRGPAPGRHEKNWMPFSVGEDLYVLYSCAPTVVLRCNASTGATQIVSEEPGPPAAAGLRGGSQGIQVREGLLFIVHEAQDDGGHRGYSHRGLLLDRDYKIAGLSPPFWFTGERVEFCAGLAPLGGDLVLAFGVGDRSAALGVVDAGELLATLQEGGPR